MINKVQQSNGVVYPLTDGTVAWFNGIYIIGESEESYRLDHHNYIGNLTLRATTKGFNTLSIRNSPYTQLGTASMVNVPKGLLPDNGWECKSSEWYVSHVVTHKATISLQVWSSYKPIYYMTSEYLYIKASSITLAISKAIVDVPDGTIPIKDNSYVEFNYE
jgi:hypothetical protein